MTLGRRRSERPPTSRQDAELVESVVVPLYSRLFARMLLPEIPVGANAQVLDVGCGTGHPTFEIVQRLGPRGRVIAVDPDAGLIGVAKQRGLHEVGRRVFFKVDTPEHLSFDDAVFDVVVCNLSLDRFMSADASLRQMRRVLAPGGRALVTRPLAGTFVELTDLLRDAARAVDDPLLLARVSDIEQHLPTPERLMERLRAAGFEDVTVEPRTHRIAFRNADELFAHRFLELGPIERWHESLGHDLPRMLDRVRHALDVYHARGPFSLTVEAALAVGVAGA